MARKKSHYFEPWSTAINPGWETPFRWGPPKYDSVDPDRRAELLDEWEGQKGRAEKSADWLIWGSRISSSDAAGREIIAALSRKLGFPPGAPSHTEFAERIVACVNAFAGVIDPAQFMADVRALLLDMIQGQLCEDPRESPRVIGLLSRCLPPEEVEAFNAGF